MIRKQLLQFILLVSFLAWFFSCEKLENSTSIPERKGDGPEGKNRDWSVKEAGEFSKRFSKIAQQNTAARAQEVNGYAGGELFGEWANKGPFNMPGAFQFCEMDEGTDTVYAVTCGHYGGVQFIWKGTLNGDDWSVINPKHPFRYDDLIVLDNDGTRRVIAGRQEEELMYSDNAGEDWTFVSGLSGIKSTVINRQDDNMIYSANGSTVYRSQDNGTTFEVFQSFSNSASNVRLFSPRWSSQPNSSDVYLVRDGQFYTLALDGSSFNEKGTLPNNGRIAIGGDTRKLWVTLNGKVWYYSTDAGNTFNYQETISFWYNDQGTDMSSGQFIGVSPEDPDVLIGNYSVPLISTDGGVTVNSDAKSYWGYYQNSVGNDPKVRINYHPDFQSHQFFYDKNGDLMTLRSSDGGVFRSYNEWTKASFPSYSDIEDVYYNISLINKPTQETYRGGFMYGYLSPDHMSCGTQDQGWQDTRSSTFGDEKLYWNQIAGGDGPCCISGDGKIGWSYDYFGKKFRRIDLYSGDEFKGQNGTRSSEKEFTFTGGSYFTPSVGDWEDGNRIWVLSQSLRKIEYNESNQQITAEEDLFGTGSSFIQGLAQSRVNADLVFTMRNGEVYKSTNRGTDWSQISTSSETGITGYSQNRGMAWASPVDIDKVLFATQSGTDVKTIYSEDGGSSWEDVTGSGDNLFPAAEVNGMAGSSDGRFVFASTNMGPYVFNVSTKKWYSLATDGNVPLFWGQIVHCVKYSDEKEYVHFSTWGQGVWSFEIQENLVANDLSVKSIENVTPEGCETTISPLAIIENNGTEEVNSLIAYLYVDEQLEQTISKNNLTLTNKTEVSIQFDELVLNTGEVNVRVEVALSNDLEDEFASNNMLDEDVTITGGTLHNFAIAETSMSSKINWQISDESNTVLVASSAIESYTEGSDEKYEFCLVPGCYSIRIEDAFTAGCDEDEWDVSAVYSGDAGSGGAGTGEVVHYGGGKYRALWWASGSTYTPGEHNVWEDLGICESSNATDELSLSQDGQEPYFEIVVGDYVSPQTEDFCVGEILNKEESNTQWLASMVSIYPNPVSDYVTINPKGENVAWKLFDINGKQLQFGKTNGSEKINLSSYKNGVYFMNILKGQKSATIEMIKY